MKANGKASSADKTMNFVLIVIIVAVLAAGVFAVYQKVSDNMFNKAIEDGTAPQTVATLARQDGVSVEQFLAEYGIDDPSIDGDTSQTDFFNKMPISKYAAYQGVEYDEFLSECGLTDKVTEDTTWEEAQELIPLGIYIGGDLESEDTLAQIETIKEQYELDASVTAETPWGEVAPIINAKEEEWAAEAESAASEADTEGSVDETAAEDESAEDTGAADEADTAEDAAEAEVPQAE